MSNWCECDLQVQGPASKVDEFLIFARGPELLLDFNRIVPYPKHFQELDQLAAAWEQEHPGEWEGRPADGFNQGGCEWCVVNWGTKWPPKKPQLRADKEQHWSEGGTEYRSVEMTFATAWSPPKPLVRRAAELFPELTIELRYFERGSRFSGLFVCKDEEVVADEQGAYFGDRGG